MRTDEQVLELYEELFADVEDIVRFAHANRNPQDPRRLTVLCAEKTSGRMWLEHFVEVR